MPTQTMKENLRENWGILAGLFGFSVSVTGAINVLNGIIALTLALGTLILVGIKIHVRLKRDRRIDDYLKKHNYSDKAFLQVYGKPKDDDTE